MTAYTGQAAGAAVRNDRITLTPAQLAPISGSPAIGAVGTNSRTAGYLFDASSTEIVGGAVWIPADWNTLTVDLYWTNAGAGSGNVAWRFDMGAITDGATLADPTAGTLVASAAPTQNTAKRSYLTATALAAPEGLAAFEVIRVATDGADTLANDAAVVAVVITRAS